MSAHQNMSCNTPTPKRTGMSPAAAQTGIKRQKHAESSLNAPWQKHQIFSRRRLVGDHTGNDPLDLAAFDLSLLASGGAISHEQSARADMILAAARANAKLANSTRLAQKIESYVQRSVGVQLFATKLLARLQAQRHSGTTVWNQLQSAVTLGADQLAGSAAAAEAAQNKFELSFKVVQTTLGAALEHHCGSASMIGISVHQTELSKMIDQLAASELLPRVKTLVDAR